MPDVRRRRCADCRELKRDRAFRRGDNRMVVPSALPRREVCDACRYEAPRASR